MCKTSDHLRGWEGRQEPFKDKQKLVAVSQLKLVIQDALDAGLPRNYAKPLYEHMFESYPGRDAGVCRTPA